MDTLNWEEVSYSHDFISPIRYSFRDRARYNAFVHDFYEFFWVDEGSCIHEVQGKGAYYLQKNELSFVPPGQVHEFISVSYNRKPFIIVSVLINAYYLDNMLKRYPELLHFLHMIDHASSYSVTLTIPQKERLSYGIENLAYRAENRFEDDLFTLNLFNEIHITQEQSLESTCPHWLKQTIQEMKLQKNFSLGCSQFETISGRCYEHITRLMKKHLSITPNQLLQQYRMEYAANRLRTTTESIVDIAMDCGYNSISQFYKVFYIHFKTTPNKYRSKDSYRNLNITTITSK